jgi:hypothetical protein
MAFLAASRPCVDIRSPVQLKFRQLPLGVEQSRGTIATKNGSEGLGEQIPLEVEKL